VTAGVKWEDGAPSAACSLRANYQLDRFLSVIISDAKEVGEQSGKLLNL
jgi:hypothetical protein